LPLPPPEPPPASSLGYPWEEEPWWNYTISEDDDDMDEISVEDESESQAMRNIEEWRENLWTRLVSNFIDSFDPLSITQVLEFGMPTPPQKKEVTIYLSDPRPLWQRILS
jgi:hypothetical protein